jgi:hypothetical protein
VLTVDGVLDATTYLPMLEAIGKAALDEPRIVIIDISWLTVREDPAWAVFTSARWQIAEWPGVPIGLVSSHEQDRNDLHRNGITRYMPLYATVELALSELSAARPRSNTCRAEQYPQMSGTHCTVVVGVVENRLRPGGILGRH